MGHCSADGSQNSGIFFASRNSNTSLLQIRDHNELSGSVRRIVSHLFLNHGFLSMAVFLSCKPGSNFSREGRQLVQRIKQYKKWGGTLA